MTLTNTILSVTRRTVKGFTVGEIFDRVQARAVQAGSYNMPRYSSVRARVYELASSGLLSTAGVRKDSLTGREAAVFVRN